MYVVHKYMAFTYPSGLIKAVDHLGTKGGDQETMSEIISVSNKGPAVLSNIVLFIPGSIPTLPAFQLSPSKGGLNNLSLI